jgi:TetR/AcrR family transcriptional regulator, transcriptional repressor for nem operon
MSSDIIGKNVVKVSKETAERNRERVIDSAATLLRERGLDGIGIADLMAAAGLTQGGFYRQFKSKDDLVLHALKRAYEETSQDLRRILAEGGDPLETLVRAYVSRQHRDDPGHGCCLTSLAVDAARHGDPALRDFFGGVVTSYLKLLTSLAPADGKPAKRRAAIAILAEMVGSIALARVMPTPELSDEIIDVVRDDLLARGRESGAAGSAPAARSSAISR